MSRDFTNWIHSGETFSASTEFVKKAKLDPGYYYFRSNYGSHTATTIPLKEDRHCSFNNGPANKIMAEIKKFWSGNKAYEALGVSHKRSILLYGPPGCGKSGIITTVIRDLTQEMKGVAVKMDNISHFTSVLKVLRQIQPKTPIVAVIEDIDNQIRNEEVAFLELFDGASTIGQNILFLSTTNNLEKIPERIRCRPSRIDTLLKIDYPDEKQRKEYIEFLLSGVESNLKVSDLVMCSKDFSLADIKELVISTFVYGKCPSDAAQLISGAKGEVDPQDEEYIDDAEDDEDE